MIYDIIICGFIIKCGIFMYINNRLSNMREKRNNIVKIQ